MGRGMEMVLLLHPLRNQALPTGNTSMRSRSQYILQMFAIQSHVLCCVLWLLLSRFCVDPQLFRDQDRHEGCNWNPERNNEESVLAFPEEKLLKRGGKNHKNKLFLWGFPLDNIIVPLAQTLAGIYDISLFLIRICMFDFSSVWFSKTWPTGWSAWKVLDMAALTHVVHHLSKNGSPEKSLPCTGVNALKRLLLFMPGTPTILNEKSK